ncbi:MAG: hypothetical protein HY908_05250 [Myxococcales bacterium]|nr:hypothetical protein [Myxococcales bacterium]
MKERLAWIVVGLSAVVLVPAACKKDSDTTNTTTTTTTSTTSTGQGGGGGSEPDCKLCLQTSATTGACTAELTACLGDSGSGGGGGGAPGCLSCSEWAMGCQNISTLECNDTMVDLCDTALALPFITCTCGECAAECPLSCAPF